MQYKKVHGIFAEFCEDLLLGLGILFFFYYYFIFFFLSFLSVKLSGLRNKTKDHRGIDFQAQRY